MVLYLNFFIMLYLIIIFLILICYHFYFYCSWDFEKVECLYPLGASGCSKRNHFNLGSISLVCSLPNRSFYQLDILSINGEKVVDLHYYVNPLDFIFCIIIFVGLTMVLELWSSNMFYPIRILTRLITLPILLLSIHYLYYFILWYTGGADYIACITTSMNYDIVWRSDYEYIFTTSACIIFFQTSYYDVPFIFRCNIRLLLFIALLFIYSFFYLFNK